MARAGSSLCRRGRCRQPAPCSRGPRRAPPTESVCFLSQPFIMLQCAAFPECLESMQTSEGVPPLLWTSTGSACSVQLATSLIEHCEIASSTGRLFRSFASHPFWVDEHNDAMNNPQFTTCRGRVVALWVEHSSNISHNLHRERGGALGRRGRARRHRHSDGTCFVLWADTHFRCQKDP